MNVRNILSSGDFVTPVPAGLPITLQYSVLGIIEKVYYGIDVELSRLKDITSILKEAVVKHNSIPNKITITDGTTWVRGVLYTSQTFIGSGKLPDCVYDDMIKAFLSDPMQFNFFAGDVESLSLNLNGAAAVRKWLGMSRFNILPGKVMPMNVSEATLDMMFNTPTYPFKWPIVSHYIIYNKDGKRIASTDLGQHIVKSVEVHVDEFGFIDAHILIDSDDTAYCKNYADVVARNIQPGTILYTDDEFRILYALTVAKNSVPNQLLCSFCGAKINVPSAGLVYCQNPNCMSIMYPKIQHMLTELGLPGLEYSEYCKYVSDGYLTCMSDALLLDKYKDIEISVSIAELMRAVVPEDEVVSDEIFPVFVGNCNGNLKTVLYYIHNPNMLVDNLSHISGHMQLFEWLKSDANVCELETILTSSNIHIVESRRKFDGAPIFRNKKIFITGMFTHGDYNNISAILHSYSASVVTNYNDNFDCVLIGDIATNVCGPALRKATGNHIPIYIESDFFDTYEIDNDLRENL